MGMFGSLLGAGLGAVGGAAIPGLGGWGGAAVGSSLGNMIEGQDMGSTTTQSSTRKATPYTMTMPNGAKVTWYAYGEPTTATKTEGPDMTGSALSSMLGAFGLFGSRTPGQVVTPAATPASTSSLLPWVGLGSWGGQGLANLGYGG